MALNWLKTKSSFHFKAARKGKWWKKFYKHSEEKRTYIKMGENKLPKTWPIIIIVIIMRCLFSALSLFFSFRSFFLSRSSSLLLIHVVHIFSILDFGVFCSVRLNTILCTHKKWSIVTIHNVHMTKLDIYFIFTDSSPLSPSLCLSFRIPFLLRQCYSTLIHFYPCSAELYLRKIIFSFKIYNFGIVIGCAIVRPFDEHRQRLQ